MNSRLQDLPLKLFCGLVGVLLVAPTVVLIPMSFTSGSTLIFPPPGYSDRWYANYFSDDTWTAATLHSVEVGLLAAGFAVVLGTSLGLALVRGRTRLSAAIGILAVAPAIVPTVVTGVGTYFVMVNLNLTGSMLGIALAHAVLGIPLVVITVAASASTLDPALERAAASLGAGKFATFRFILLPALMPGVLIGALYAFQVSWEELAIALFITSPTYLTLPVKMWQAVTLSTDPTVATVSIMLVGLVLIGMVMLVVARGLKSSRRAVRP